MSALGHELPQSFEQALKLARRLLSRNHELIAKNVVDTEAEQIVLAAFRKASGRQLSRMDLFTRMEDRFPEAAGEPLIVMAARRAEGKLLQHLIGYQTFLDHEYEVGPDVLIPRPETEVLVTIAAEKILQNYGEPEFGLEVGVGSGAIAIELLSKFLRLRILGSELTEVAAARARTNARRILMRDAVDHARLKVVLAQSPLEVWEPFEREGLRRKAQFLISNPPYLSQASSAETEADVSDQEPGTALFAPSEDPVHFYRQIAQGAKKVLEPDGLVFVEIPHERSAVIAQLFRAESWKVEIQKDLNGRDRVLSARL